MIKMSELIKKQNDEIRKKTKMFERTAAQVDKDQKDLIKQVRNRKKNVKAMKKAAGEDPSSLSEVDFEKVKLPSNVNRYLGRFVQSMKDANLNRLKRSAILYKVIEASGMSVQQLMADIQKIKKELK